MKKYLYGILALAGILTISCNKVAEPEVVVPESAAGKHLVSIKASIAPETRTSYADDKSFSWVKDDSITVITLSPDEQYIRLSTFYAQSSGPETVFTGEVEEGYTLYTMAFYTAANSSVAFGGEGDSNIYFYLPSGTAIDGDPETEYTVESANPLANMPLIGVQQEDDSYLFYSATGAAKFTFTDIPEGASYFVVELSDEPLSGYFTWNDEGVITNDTAREGTYTYTATDGTERTARYANHYVLYHFERNADGTGTVYMPLPVGKIPAGSRIGFYDENLEDLLYSRTVRADIPIERNRVTEVNSFAAVAPQWESMGYGYFYDMPVFYYMTPEADRENEDILYRMSTVEFFQDPNVPGVYRFENPYKIAAEQRGFSIAENDLAQMDDYLTVTVLRDNYVIYDDFYTGYHYSLTSGNVTRDGHVFAACPGNWGDDNRFNFVAKYQEDGTPQEIFLSSLYLYNWGTGTYYWSWPDSWSYMWTTLIFPGAEEQIDLNMSVELEGIADDTPAQPTGRVKLTLGQNTDITAVDLVIARNAEEAEAMIAAGLAVRATESGSFVANFPADAPSGSYLAFGKNVPAEGFTANCAILAWSEEEFDYFRKDEDRGLELEDVIGAYTASNYYYYNGWTDEPVALTLSVEESDDPLGGDIMFTDLCPEIVKAMVPRGTPQAVPVYAYFDTATGIITIPAGTVAYTVTVGRVTTSYTVADYSGKDVSLFLREPGVIYCKNNIAFYQNGTRAAWTNTETTFNRNAAGSAPARSYGFESPRYIRTANPTAKMPVYMQQSSVELPFLGAKPGKASR